MKFNKLILGLATVILSTSVFAANETKSNSGYFSFKNDTNKKITIHVGNWIPTEYNIAPHSSKTIAVSTDNQNIRLSKAE